MVFSRRRNITDPSELAELKIQMNDSDVVHFGSVFKLVQSSFSPKFNSVYCTCSGFSSNAFHCSLCSVVPCATK